MNSDDWIDYNFNGSEYQLELAQFELISSIYYQKRFSDMRICKEPLFWY